MTEDYGKRSVALHEAVKGKIEVISRVPAATKEDLSLAYTPGVATPCLEIEKDPSRAYELTRKWNTVAVITNGTAVLGLGNIGPAASMPVMEGKCVLFKEFGDVDAIPLCLNTTDPEEFVNAVALLENSFGGINLEDIASPSCFEIEKKLAEKVNIPVFHDDQHGTAIVVLAGLINALKITGKKPEEIRVVHNGPGAAGTAIIRLLQAYGIRDITVVDRTGILNKEDEGLKGHLRDLAETTNPRNLKGTLKDAIKDADVFIGTSVGNILSEDMVRSMNPDPIIFACANPTPEIDPQLAKKAGAALIATGRSDLPNQVNNVLIFPGLFRGLLDSRVKKVTQEMKLACAKALASVITDDELSVDYILPEPFDPRVKDVIAQAVKKEAAQR